MITLHTGSVDNKPEFVMSELEYLDAIDQLHDDLLLVVDNDTSALYEIKLSEGRLWPELLDTNHQTLSIDESGKASLQYEDPIFN